MTDKITYYAMTDEDSSRIRPRTVLRRIESSQGQTDEIFSRDFEWEPSPLLHSAEHGDVTNDFTEVSEAEAEQIVARIRADAVDELYGNETWVFRGRPGLRSQRCSKLSIASLSQSLPVRSSYIGAGKAALLAESSRTRCGDTPRISAASGSDTSSGSVGRAFAASSTSCRTASARTSGQSGMPALQASFSTCGAPLMTASAALVACTLTVASQAPVPADTTPSHPSSSFINSSAAASLTARFSALAGGRTST